MSAVLQSPENIVNAALARIGRSERVGSIYEGTRVADAAIVQYGQTRDDLLRGGDWPFAQCAIMLTLLKSAPQGGYIPPILWDATVNPPVPWLFEYAWPDDCLKVLSVKPVPVFVPNFDPQPFGFSIWNDKAFAPAQRVILSNVSSATCDYTGQVTDPTTMPTDFIEAFIAALAERLAPALDPKDGLQEAQFEQAESGLENVRAREQQG